VSDRGGWEGYRVLAEWYAQVSLSGRASTAPVVGIIVRSLPAKLANSLMPAAKFVRNSYF